MSSILTLQQRKNAFIRLGQYLLAEGEQLNQLIQNAQHYNGWFTPSQTLKAVKAFGNLLTETNLNQWLSFEQAKNFVPKKIGLVLAGNIPLVGFHDILSVLATAHTALVKLSSQDKQLIPHVLSKLIEFEPLFSGKIIYTERLENFDAVVATGNTNTSRYFEYYFSKVPHIIRKNRNSIAVLTGNEAAEDLNKLGHDIFDYFGLGCRSVSKLYVPKGYNFNMFFESIESYKNIFNHSKYNNNYDYNKSIYLVNRDQHLDNGFLLLKADQRLASPLAVVFYEEYEDLTSVEETISTISATIQCLVSTAKLSVSVQQVGFGESQQPKLWDYADGIDTIAFLLSL